MQCSGVTDSHRHKISHYKLVRPCDSLSAELIMLSGEQNAIATISNLSGMHGEHVVHV